MVNTWATWTRRRWRAEKATEDLPEGPAPGDLAADVAVRLAIRGALASLTARQRAVLVLRVFDDLSEAQVARILDCAVGTVKSTMSQALAKLRNDPRLADVMEAETR
jgi:RNA polymerase sigma factor (sigma-70 family)